MASPGHQLRNAAEACDIDEVESLINSGVDVNDCDSNGYTALHWAARDGNVEVTELLLKRGANIDIREYFGRTPLHYAARDGRIAVVKMLLDAGADPCAVDAAGWTPYRYAHKKYQCQLEPDTEYTYIGFDEVMKVLEQHGGGDHPSKL